MVEFEEIKDEHYEDEDGFVDEDDDEYSDTSSVHDDDDEGIEGESILDRVVALKDIIPQQHRLLFLPVA